MGIVLVAAFGVFLVLYAYITARFRLMSEQEQADWLREHAHNPIALTPLKALLVVTLPYLAGLLTAFLLSRVI